LEFSEKEIRALINRYPSTQT